MLRRPSKRFVDLLVLVSVGALTLVTSLLYVIHVEISYPINRLEAVSYGLRGNEVQKNVFGLATGFAWFGAAYYFAGRWAERKQ